MIGKNLEKIQLTLIAIVFVICSAPSGTLAQLL